MLPDGLQRPVAPAVTLPPERTEGGGSLRPCARLLDVDDLPARPADGEREIRVLGERGARDAAHFLQRAAAESADCPGDRGHALERVVETTVEVEAHDVLDVLPAAEQPTAVSHLRVPRDASDPAVSEGLHQPLQRLGLEDRVGVDHDDHVVASGCDATVQCFGLAAVLLAQNQRTDVQSFNELGGGVGRSVVDDDDLEVRVVAGRERLDGPLDADGLVEGRHHDRDGRHERLVRGSLACEARVPAGKPQQQKHAQAEQECRRDEQRGKGPGRPAGDAQGAEQQPAPGLAPVAGGQLDLVPREPGELGDRDELEASRAELGHHPLEGGNRLRAVAASVMEQDDAARIALRRDRLGDRVDSGAPPVLSVEIREGDDVSVPRELLECALLLSGHRGRVGGVRRPDEPQAEPHGACDGVVGQPDLERLLPGGQRGDVRVREGVVAELETIGVERANDIWMTGDLASDQEEGRRHVQPSKGRGDPGRPAWIGPVVEAQCNLAAGPAAAGDQPVAVPQENRPG